MKRFIATSFLGLILFLSGTSSSAAQTDSTLTKAEMKTYYLVLLRKGPNRNQDSVTASKIQAAHLANIDRLEKEGKLAVAGPFLDNGDLRGIFIFNVTSAEEAKALTDTDPAIQTGRLVAEIHPWMTMRGTKFP